MQEIKHSEVSKFLRKVWNENEKSLDAKQLAFMKAMQGVMFWLVTEADPDSNPMDNSYDSTSFLDAYSRAIEAYNAIFHIVDVSMQWKEQDDE
jgi:hypothetical protein